MDFADEQTTKGLSKMTNAVEKKKTEKLPKIALVADVPNWAFHNISKQISKHLKDEYEFKIFFYGEYPEIETLMLEVKDYDLIHFFWRDALFSFLSSWVQHSFAQKGLDYADFITNVVAKANLTTSASEHLLISESEAKERVILYNTLAIGYTTFSEKLNKILSAIPDYPQPFCNTEDGVDLGFFTPHNPERFYKNKEEIVIGWVGNSKWGQGDGVDHKGWETIIDPVVQNLREEGYKVRGEYADRHVKWTPHEEMNDYYNTIDIYVCASDIEGTPNPILESMACGLPVISTDVGIVPDVFGKYQKEYILTSRTKESLKEKLKDLIENPHKRELLSKENLAEIKNWSWEKQCQKWNEFFKAMLSISENKCVRERRDYLRKITLESYLKDESDKLLEQISIVEDSDKTNLKTQINEMENFLGDLQMKISLMEESKFWKIRGKWFNLKKKLGFAKNQS